MAYRSSSRNRAQARTAAPQRSAYSRTWDPKIRLDRNAVINKPIKILSQMDIPQTGYFVMHDSPGDNVIHRDVPNPIFDIDDVRELDSTEIYELLPKEPSYPDTAPQNLELYCANWSRVIDFGGVTDSDKDPRIDTTDQWNVDQWTTRHKWPAVATLDPTYVFFTQDPALFYTQRVISHYEPDLNGDLLPVMIPDNDIIWKLNGQEVHRGWFMDLSALSRTVEVVQGQAAIVPKLLSVEAHNEEGSIRKELKFAAIDSDDGALAGGSDQTDNFSSTLEGQFIADEDADSEDYRSAIFWPDPRYGPRTMYVRFLFNNFGRGKSRRRKFRKAKGTFKVDGAKNFSISGTQIQDKWQRKDRGQGNHQDAMADFPEIFNSNGRLKGKYRNNGGSKLAEIGVTDWTEGRASAIFMDEVNNKFSRLIKFQKKPGPFDLDMFIRFKVRRKGIFSKKVWRTWAKKLEYKDEELNLDTPLQPIDLGVVNIGYKTDD